MRIFLIGKLFNCIPHPFSYIHALSVLSRYGSLERNGKKCSDVFADRVEAEMSLALHYYLFQQIILEYGYHGAFGSTPSHVVYPRDYVAPSELFPDSDDDEDMPDFDKYKGRVF